MFVDKFVPLIGSMLKSNFINYLFIPIIGLACLAGACALIREVLNV